MRVEKTTSATGQWGLRATSEDYDGTPPLPVIQFDRQPRTLSPDRVALASFMFFNPWISGRYASPQWHSPALSQAMGRHVRPAWIQTEPVELYAKALPKGRRPLHVSMEDVPSLRSTSVRGCDSSLKLTRSDRSVGARLSSAALELSTNAWMLTAGRGRRRQLEVVLACGLLYAEDLEADELIISSDVDDKDARDFADLIGAARIGLRIV